MNYARPFTKECKEKKHIAMYIGSLGNGGAERVMSNLAEFFYSEGYDVTIVTTYYEDDGYELPHSLWKKAIDGLDSSKYAPEEVITPQDELRIVYHLIDENASGIRRVFTGLMPDEKKGRIYNFRARTRKLEETWRRIQPDLILSFIGKNNLMAIKTATKFGIPVIVSVRANPPMEYYTKTLVSAANKLFPKAAGVVLQTNGAAAFFDEKVREKCAVLPNSVSESFIDKTVVPFEDRSKTIVTVGRIDENKNQRLLIRAFAKLSNKYPDYKLLIIGDGNLKKILEEEALQQLGSSRCAFTGNIDNVPERIADARAFVLTSKEEGMPNALIEAMTLGLVGISTDCPCGGPRDIISDGEDGILIPMGTDAEMEEALVSALDKVMGDDNLASKMSENALKTRDRYNPERINGMWKEYFEKVMSEASENKTEKRFEKKTLVEYIKQFISFGLIGGLNTILSLGIYWLIVNLGGHYMVGNAVAFFITVAISYVLNNIFTFKGEGKAEWSIKNLLKVYISYGLTGLLLNTFLLMLWIDWLGINENLAPIINLFFTIPLNFLLNKFWAYKKK